MDLKWAERNLCSARDPEREALGWLAQIYFYGNHLWVLGLGAGYHVNILLRQFPDLHITVIDHRPELLAQFQFSQSEFSSRCQLLYCRNGDDLLNSLEYEDRLSALGAVVEFMPAIHQDLMLYRDFAKNLRGQTSKSFLRIAGGRGLALKRLPESFEDFQIKFVSSHLSADTASDIKLKIELLRELVE